MRWLVGGAVAAITCTFLGGLCYGVGVELGAVVAIVAAGLVVAGVGVIEAHDRGAFVLRP